MSASVHEALMAQVKTILLAAGTMAADRVYRGRVDALAPEDMPGINIRRGTGIHSDFASGAQHQVMEFMVDHHVRGPEWETAADAMHMQVHAALAASAELALLCKGLRCVRTEPSAEGGDETIGAITATYQAQALVRPNNLTQAVRG